MTVSFPLPGVKHGGRIMISVLESRARDEPDSPWASVPIVNDDLSKGYRDITFREFNNAVNRAAHWLNENLPKSSEPFQCFAYAGPKDLRYPVLAAAAGKAQKVMVLPSPLVTAEAQLNILNKKNCTVYVRPQSLAEPVGAILQKAPGVQAVTGPELDELFQEAEAKPYIYDKTWDEGKRDPWLVFHTSGTTGNPKPVTYTHEMMAAPDTVAAIPDIEESQIHHYALTRWYTPLPSMHFVGMLSVLCMTTFLKMTAVIGPPGPPPSPQTIEDILHYGRADGAILVPALIDQICATPSGLKVLQGMEYVHYAGAPLSPKTGELLETHVQLVNCIGSTEAAGYLTKIRKERGDWDYVEFQKHAGAVMEPRLDNHHELVFVRRPECLYQPIFLLYPDRDRFETNDLWVEHPTRKGLWKIIGRSDDYVYFSHGDGLHAATLESMIEHHPAVQSALIGGHGRPAPVVIIELKPGLEKKTNGEEAKFVESLKPYIDKVNSTCHPCVELSLDRLIFVSPAKPFVRTLKGSVSRQQSLNLYKEEISKLFGGKV